MHAIFIFFSVLATATFSHAQRDLLPENSFPISDFLFPLDQISDLRLQNNRIAMLHGGGRTVSVYRLASGSLVEEFSFSGFGGFGPHAFSLSDERLFVSGNETAFVFRRQLDRWSMEFVLPSQGLVGAMSGQTLILHVPFRLPRLFSTFDLSQVAAPGFGAFRVPSFLPSLNRALHLDGHRVAIEGSSLLGNGSSIHIYSRDDLGWFPEGEVVPDRLIEVGVNIRALELSDNVMAFTDQEVGTFIFERFQDGWQEAGFIDIPYGDVQSLLGRCLLAGQTVFVRKKNGQWIPRITLEGDFVRDGVLSHDKVIATEGLFEDQRLVVYRLPKAVQGHM